jgi:hypothetical protein
MLDRFLRDIKERLCIPIARVVGKVFSPSQITVIGFFCGLLSVLFISWQWWLAGNIFWYLNRILDGIDGVVARLRHEQSDFGGYIDIICDFIIYALLPIALTIAITSNDFHVSNIGDDSTTAATSIAQQSSALGSCAIDQASIVMIPYDSIMHQILPMLVPRMISPKALFVLLALLESTYFVNAASQMFMASILEKRSLGARATGKCSLVGVVFAVKSAAVTPVCR